MIRKIKENQNLIGLLLGPIRESPAMYLGEAKLSRLPNFIVGYNMAYEMLKDENSQVERYFDEPGFINWFFGKYNLGPTNTWMNPFRDQVNGDDFKALQIFFKHLEEYSDFLNSR